jgi:hypothetical protein
MFGRKKIRRRRRNMKIEDRILGEHIGNLLYHLDVLKKAQSLRKIQLFRIRKKLTDQEKVVIYKNFSKEVDERIERLSYHVDKLYWDCLTEDSRVYAKRIRNSDMRALEREKKEWC